MSTQALAGDPRLEIRLKRSKQARRMSLRVSRLDGRITLTLPFGVDEDQAWAFAREKQDWLRRQVKALDQPVRVGRGALVPFQGHQRMIVEGTGARIQIAPDRIIVPGHGDQVGRRLLGHFKQLARAELTQASDHYAKALGRGFTKISIRDTRSRWGSCTAQGGLMYSWRLIMAPRDVLTYVAAHEVAHLAELNHSAAFWAVVQDIYGDFETPRNWLRENGHTLHQFRFED